MVLSNGDWQTVILEKVTEVIHHADTDIPGLRNVELSNELIARTIDHTLLKPEATTDQIKELCEQAIAHKFKSCCVNGTNVKQVAELLEGSSTIACCVIGFPLGASTTATKVFEAKDAIQNGAKEIDMVLNIGALKSGNYTLVFSDIQEVVAACSASDVLVKVIIETVYLSFEEKIAASFIAAEAGAAFVKTCTGFSLAGGGATAQDVVLMKRTVMYKPGVMVKASAGIRSYDKCVEMLRAGADRIGTSSGVDIIKNGGTAGEGY